jgi:hypothetical protein
MKKLCFLGVCLGLVVLFNTNVWAEQAKSGKQQFKPKEIKIDRNFDGVAERTEVYDDKGFIQRVEVDSDADGKVDEWVYYEKGVAVKGEKDTNKDGKADTTMFYDAKGVVIRTETDVNGDGKVDEWVFYANGVPVKAEKDTNNDGKVDTWLNY